MSSVQYIYFIEVAKHTLKQTSKITAITTPGSLERTFDPGFDGFFRKQLDGEESASSSLRREAANRGRPQGA